MLWPKQVKMFEEELLAKGVSFELTANSTYLVNKKYYVTTTGRWRQKGKYTWYMYSQKDGVGALMDKLFGDIDAYTS